MQELVVEAVQLSGAIEGLVTADYEGCLANVQQTGAY